MRRCVCLLSVIAVLAGCQREPSLVRYRAMLNLLQQIETELNRSVGAEKGAVLAAADRDAEAFASQAREAAAAVDRDLAELRALVVEAGKPGETAKLEALEHSWWDLKTIDARLLTLALANSNPKALRLSTEEGARSMNRLVTALEQIAATGSAPDEVREPLSAAIAVLRIQTLQSPHIAAARDDVMLRLEAQIAEASEIVERVLGRLVADPAGRARPQVEAAVAAWRDYQVTLEEVVRLSRENSDVRAFDLSIHEKQRAADACRAAIAALAAEIRASQPATR